jgi:3'-phosphoadenosine 5'-phosphosulfate sulfotransferase (PAPS reductase)/FAD synthetase
MNIKLKNFDLIIINSSAGKDSLCSIYEIMRMAKAQNVDSDRIVVSHQDLGEAEWGGTFELAKRQADLFGLEFYTSKRRDRNGYEESLLEYAERRGKWPSSQQRWCTSDFKRGPGARVVTKLTKGMQDVQVLYVFGFRKEESPSRAKKQAVAINKNLTTKSRTVIDYLPIHDWSVEKVWETIHDNELPYHPAYDLGMPRLSCTFCIFSPFDALVVAGYHNPKLLQKYVDIEDRIDHTFKADHSLKDVQRAIADGYRPDTISDWKM